MFTNLLAQNIIFPMFLTIIIEVPGAWLFFKIRDSSSELFKVALVNGITNPILNLAILMSRQLFVSHSSGTFLLIVFVIIGEVIVFVAETICYRWAMNNISWKKATVMSLVLNALSFFIGLLVAGNIFQLG